MTESQKALVIRSRRLFIKNSSAPVVIRPLTQFQAAVLRLQASR